MCRLTLREVVNILNTGSTKDVDSSEAIIAFGRFQHKTDDDQSCQARQDVLIIHEALHNYINNPDKKVNIVDDNYKNFILVTSDISDDNFPQSLVDTLAQLEEVDQAAELNRAIKNAKLYNKERPQGVAAMPTLSAAAAAAQVTRE